MLQAVGLRLQCNLKCLVHRIISSKHYEWPEIVL